MANQKISDRTAAASIDGTEELAIAKAGTDRKVNIDSIKTYVDCAMSAPYTGTDAPGAGSNTLNNGKSRVWHNTTTGKSYLLTNYSGNYRAVELTTV